MILRTRTAHPLMACLTLFLFACGSGDGDAGATADAEGVAASDTADSMEGMDHGEMAAAGLLDPNEASDSELMALPHFDAALTEALVAGRPYADMLAVDAVLAGQLDEAQREAVYAHLFKRIDLNNASEEEILLIPGVGDRMAHEFDEYRPYRAMEEFRREIGKYVDEAEVARLERYVELRGN